MRSVHSVNNTVFSITTFIGALVVGVTLFGCAADDTPEEEGSTSSLQKKRGGNHHDNGPGGGRDTNGKPDEHHDDGPGGRRDTKGACYDTNVYCSDWASNGECARNPGYMLQSCCISCSLYSEAD